MNSSRPTNTSSATTPDHAARRVPIDTGTIRPLSQVLRESTPSVAASDVDSLAPTIFVDNRNWCGTHRHDAPTERYDRLSARGSGQSWVDDASTNADDPTEDSVYESAEVGAKRANDGRRTLYLSGFSPTTTYRDLLSLIKGGKLLSASLRSEGYALVAFIEDAASFLSWAQNSGLVLNGRWVSLAYRTLISMPFTKLLQIKVKWADYQHPIHGHVAREVAKGATRNIVIRDAAGKGLTESIIRSDMEHIHNMIIIDVAFNANGDARVSTNSIHVALYARTCMMSRIPYKGCKIEFVADECDVPLPIQPILPHRERPAPAPQRQASYNRFDMLRHNVGSSTGDEM